MNSAKGVECAICYDSICCDSTKYKSIKLTCGHAFGKSCMRKWVESSNQKKCPVCTNQLTDNKIKEIKNIPLQERVVIFLEKTSKLIGRTIVELVPSFAVAGAVFGAADGAVSGGILIAAATVLITAGAAAGAVAAATGASRDIGTAAGAAAGAAVGATVAIGGLAVAASAGGFGAASGGIRDACVVGAAAGGCGVIVGGFIGGITADILYSQQEMNPVVV